MKPTWILLVVFGVAALLCFVTLYTGYFTFAGYSLSGLTVWNMAPVQKENSTQPVSLMVVTDPHQHTPLSPLSDPHQHTPLSPLSDPHQHTPLSPLSDPHQHTPLSPLSDPHQHTPLTPLSDPHQHTPLSPLSDPHQHTPLSPLSDPHQHTPLSPLSDPHQHTPLSPLSDPHQHTSLSPLSDPHQHTPLSPLSDPHQHTPLSPLSDPHQHTPLSPLSDPHQHTPLSPLSDPHQHTPLSPLSDPHQHTPLSPLSDPHQHTPLTPLSDPHQHTPLSPLSDPHQHTPLTPLSDPHQHTPLTPLSDPYQEPPVYQKSDSNPHLSPPLGSDHHQHPPLAQGSDSGHPLPPSQVSDPNEQAPFLQVSEPSHHLAPPPQGSKPQSTGVTITHVPPADNTDIRTKLLQPVANSHAKPGMLSPKPVILSPKPGIVSPKSSVVSPKPSILSPTPDILFPKPDILPPKPGIQLPKPVVSSHNSDGKSIALPVNQDRKPIPVSVNRAQNVDPSPVGTTRTPVWSVSNVNRTGPSVTPLETKPLPPATRHEEQPVAMGDGASTNRKVAITTQNNLSGLKDGNHPGDSATGKQLSLGPGVYTYPEWWRQAWPRSAVWNHRNQFVGDQPLYPPCVPDSDTAGTAYPFVEPKHYLAQSRNPCWYQKTEEGRELMCVPYFYLAGVAKCGTTDLAKRMRLHPQIFAGTMKEYHWWERYRFGSHDEEDMEDSTELHGGMTFKEYTERITGHDIHDLQTELKNTGSSVRIFGDYSPSYLWDPRHWYSLAGNQNCSEPRQIVGQHIRHVFPDAKVMLTLRHPTPRLYSRFVSRTTRTRELRKASPEDFHRYVMEGIDNYKRCFQDWSIRHCAYNVSLYRDTMVRLVEGMYPVFMADWLRVWSRDQMFLLRYEDYGGQERQRLAEVFHFLGVAPLEEDDMDDLLSFHPVNAGTEQYHKVGAMMNETRTALDEFYQPFIVQLAELLNDTRFLWSDVEH